MLVAMMTPMLTEPIRHLLDRGFVKRRFRSLILFLAAYFMVWISAAPLMLLLVSGLRSFFSDPVTQAGIAATVALSWQCSPAKQRFLNRLHGVPDLAAFGTRADLDACKFGFNHGIKCFGSCWALMGFSEVCSVGHLFAMAVVTVWLVAEHLERPAKPRWHLPNFTRATNILAWQFYQLSRGMSRAVNPSGALQRLRATLAESPDHSSRG
jgi:predicted metal-binding membrane protein